MSKRKWNGSKWIRKERRLSIYLRDGMACVYCGATIEDGVVLSLDHIKPDSNGGSNLNTNLVTCCRKCNSSRGNRGLREFCKVVAGYVDHGITWNEIETHVLNCAQRHADIVTARKLLDRRNGRINDVLLNA